jgi:Protein of unknown function (DUF3095)
MSQFEFYKKLKPIREFVKAANPELYTDLPADWLIVITDIVASTKAIEAGRYKDVNTLGAALIAGIQNLLPDLELPFVFGGDGAIVAVPSELLEHSRDIVREVKLLGEQAFGLEIRGAIIPIGLLYKLGGQLKVSKLQLSTHFTQALMLGNGLDLAEKILKDPKYKELRVKDTDKIKYQTNFNGLECRWQDVPSRHGEIVSLIVKAQTDNLEQSASIYSEVLAGIESIYGKPLNYQPVLGYELELSLKLRDLNRESTVRTGGRGLASRLYLTKIWLINLVGKLQEATGIEINGFNIQKKKQAIRVSTDYKKIDGALKIVFASSTRQRLKLVNLLNVMHMSFPLKYGIHVSNRALLTCLVFQGLGQEAHFVDGADGGLALAAKQLKSS